MSHHSFIQYQLPTTGELVPLPQIAPSKSDAERLLVISPELAEVLSAIVQRVRNPDGSVPLVVSYDIHERVWNPPMPLSFQRRLGMENRPISAEAIRALLVKALAGTGPTDASNRALHFVPHDFRRLFITDAIHNEMPPHIAQLVCGHKDINTTMGITTPAYRTLRTCSSRQSRRAPVWPTAGSTPDLVGSDDWLWSLEASHQPGPNFSAT